MDSPPTSEPEIQQPVALEKVGITESKRRKKEEKVVITVRIEEGGVKQKSNGNPGDSWSWRKYGQKPIKGSPHPRGYYRCSTAKGCPAKKQVERSRTDASTLIITYSSSHNHPGPELIHPNSTAQAPVPFGLPEDKPDQAEEGGGKLHCAGDVPTGGGESLECPGGVMTTLSAEGQLLGGDGGDPDGDDFFDELGELPLSLLCSRGNFFDERMLLLQVPIEHRNGWG